MKSFYCSIFCCFLFFNALSQISTSSFPENLQLFMRKDNNTCDVQITGHTTNTNTVFKLYKNGNLLSSAPISAGSFNFMTSLNSELSEYEFALDQNGVNVQRAEKVLCGDAIILYGQSNMVARAGVDEFNDLYSDKFTRNFQATPDAPQNFQWFTGKYPYTATGTIGSYFVQNIIDSVGIPILVINQAQGGASLPYLLEHNPHNPADENYLYGKLLTRLTKAGILDKVRYMAFFQGEAAAANWYADCNDYPRLFDSLVTYLRRDIPNLKKFYEFQINILNSHHVERAGFLRDFQRQTKKLYPGFIETLSTVGKEPFDGIHFVNEAYQDMAKELSHLVLRDFYGRIPTREINFPDVQYAYYTPNKDSVILEFQKGQVLTYNPTRDFGYYERRLSDYIYFTDDNTTIYYNQYNTNVQNGSAVGNKIILKLNNPQNFKYITYLPATFSDHHSSSYNGPNITNSSNLKAFTFYALPIANSPRVESSSPTLPMHLRAAGVNASQINLSWDSNDNSSYVLQSSLDNANFVDIYSGSDTQYRYLGLLPNTTYYFKIKACKTGNCTTSYKLAQTSTFIQPGCPNLILNLPLTGSQNFTGNQIVASSSLQGRFVFQSQTSIELRQGFVVDANAGGYFAANIGNCP